MVQLYFHHINIHFLNVRLRFVIIEKCSVVEAPVRCYKYLCKVRGLDGDCPFSQKQHSS